MKIGAPLLKDIIGWDIETWGPCLDFWKKSFNGSYSDLKTLELGSHMGGLSLYFALQGAKVICSDLHTPQKAQALHLKYGQSTIQYLPLDACAINLPTHSQDLVVFKSMLGGIRSKNEINLKLQVIQEIQRVLKPGGWLLFAENIQGSYLHMWLREHFVSWGKAWNYLDLKELDQLKIGFSEWHWETHGITALCGRNERQKNILAKIDKHLETLIPNQARYCIFVAAKKETI